MLCDKCLGQLLELESTNWKNDKTSYTIHKLCMHYIQLMLKVYILFGLFGIDFSHFI
jgi:hypothetical protein